MLGRLLFSGCLLLSLAACSLSQQAPSRTVSAAEQLVLAEQCGQLVLHWPEQRSERVAVNNKRRFLAYAGQGELLIDLQQAEELYLKQVEQLTNIKQTLEQLYAG